MSCELRSLGCSDHGCCYDRDRYMFVFFFKQKTAYEMRISDWSSDVCSSDLLALRGIAMAQLGDFGRAKALVRGAARAFGPKEPVARARRSEERRVGKECVRTCISRGSPLH